MSRSADRAPSQQALRAAFLAPATRAAQWELPTGAAGVPVARRIGQALICLSGLMAWGWALASVEAVWPLLLALLWSWHLARLWRSWCVPVQHLLLCWQPSPRAGWHVPAWGDAAVAVRVPWDGQAAFLLNVRSADGARQAWLWVRDDGGRDAHRLRTLLRVPQTIPESTVA